MKKLIPLFACLLLTSPLGIKAAAADSPEPGIASTTIPADLANAARRAEAWLRDLDTARARFIQTAQDGTQLVGTFYLNRPGKLRFEYDDPIEDFIVADGFFIYFYDATLKEQSNAPIGQTLADFLLREDLRFDGDVRISDIRRGGELLQISLVQAADPDAGTLTLGFTENPIRLKKWRVTDATNVVTEVELFQTETGVALNDRLFVYMHPERGQRQLNE